MQSKNKVSREKQMQYKFVINWILLVLKSIGKITKLNSKRQWKVG
jgi:hypothetical protein